MRAVSESWYVGMLLLLVPPPLLTHMQNEWRKRGAAPERVYDFHSSDGLDAPPLQQTERQLDVWEGPDRPKTGP